MSDAAALREAALRAAGALDLDSAHALLTQAAHLASDCGQSWFDAGLLRLAAEDHEAARIAFVAAVEAQGLPERERDVRVAALRAYDPDENRFAPVAIVRDSFDKAFYPFAAPRAVRPAEREHYGWLFDRACAARGAFAGDLCAQDLALNGETLWFHVNRGHLCWCAGQRTSADAHYAAARAIALRHGLLPDHYNEGVLVWLAEADARALLASPPPDEESGWTWAFAPPDPAPDVVVAVGCDRGYFAFLPKFLLSVAAAHRAARSGLRVVVHCHVADPSEAELDALAAMAEALARETASVRLGWSFGPAPARQAAYYTCLRFLALPRLMRAYGCGAAAFDIDGTLDPAFFLDCPRLLEHDAALRMYTFDATGRQAAGEPWSIGAHPTVLGPTPLGRAVAAFLGGYLRQAYDPALPTNWTIDQCAIAQAHDLILRPDPEARVLNLALAPPCYELPEAFGGKQAFLDHGGRVAPADFAARLASPGLMDHAFLRLPAAETLARFESLGGRMQGCEFGLVQRAAGIEPLGLLRWSELWAGELIAALDRDLDGVGSPERTTVEVVDWGKPEYVSRDTRFGMLTHLWLTPDEADMEEARRLCFQRLRFLAGKLLDDLRAAEKVFVFRETTLIPSARDLRRLHRAVARLGGASLLVATYAHGEHASGSVREAAPGLYVGYFERFRISPRYELLGDVDPVWHEVCRKTLALHARRLAAGGVRAPVSAS